MVSGCEPLLPGSCQIPFGRPQQKGQGQSEGEGEDQGCRLSVNRVSLRASSKKKGVSQAWGTACKLLSSVDGVLSRSWSLPHVKKINALTSPQLRIDVCRGSRKLVRASTRYRPEEDLHVQVSTFAQHVCRQPPQSVSGFPSEGHGLKRARRARLPNNLFDSYLH